MKENDYIKIIQHDYYYSAYKNSNDEIDIKNFEDFFKKSIWYSHIEGTHQQKYRIDSMYVGNNVNNNFLFQNRFNFVFDAIMQLILNNNYNVLDDRSQLEQKLQNYIIFKDEFINIVKSQNKSNYLNLITHLRNSFAHGAFNYLKINEKILIEMYDCSKLDYSKVDNFNFCLQLSCDKNDLLFENLEMIIEFSFNNEISDDSDEFTFYTRTILPFLNKKLHLKDNYMILKENMAEYSYEKEDNIHYFVIKKDDNLIRFILDKYISEYINNDAKINILIYENKIKNKETYIKEYLKENNIKGNMFDVINDNITIYKKSELSSFIKVLDLNVE